MEDLPERPASCTRRRLKPMVDGCGCEYCEAIDRTWLQSQEITAKDGLLWRNGSFIPVPEADAIAIEHGFVFAEDMVKALEKNNEENDVPAGIDDRSPGD